jgi:predicted RNA-binding Zn-ribbon protein involved in translation (DUF1610 family)
MLKSPAQIQEEFGPVAERYRAAAARIRFLAIGFCACLLAIGAFRPPLGATYVLGGVAALCWLAGAIVVFRQPALICPNCGENVDGQLQVHCPECGKDAIRFPDGWFQACRCTACGCALKKGRRGSRSWVIRWCTSCGVPLDERGA